MPAFAELLAAQTVSEITIAQEFTMDFLSTHGLRSSDERKLPTSWH